MTITIPRRRSGNQSGVYTWLWEHWNELERPLPGHREADWKAFAAQLAKLGVRGAKGQLATPAAVRMTFERVRAAKGPDAPSASTVQPTPLSS